MSQSGKSAAEQSAVLAGSLAKKDVPNSKIPASIPLKFYLSVQEYPFTKITKKAPVNL